MVANFYKSVSRHHFSQELIRLLMIVCVTIQIHRFDPHAGLLLSKALEVARGSTVAGKEASSGVIKSKRASHISCGYNNAAPAARGTLKVRLQGLSEQKEALQIDRQTRLPR